MVKNKRINSGDIVARSLKEITPLFERLNKEKAKLISSFRLAHEEYTNKRESHDFHNLMAFMEQKGFSIFRIQDLEYTALNDSETDVVLKAQVKARLMLVEDGIYASLKGRIIVKADLDASTCGDSGKVQCKWSLRDMDGLSSEVSIYAYCVGKGLHTLVKHSVYATEWA